MTARACPSRWHQPVGSGKVPAVARLDLRPDFRTLHDPRVGDYAANNNIELAYVPTYSSRLNRIEAQFTALRYFTIDGTDHPTHEEQALMIRRYIRWRNRHAHDRTLREIVKRANVA